MTVVVKTMLWSHKFEHFDNINPTVWTILGFNVQLSIKKVVEECERMVSWMQKCHMQNFDNFVDED